MPPTADATMTYVTAPDGVEIAVFVSGRGRPLVVVPGTTSDHTTWRLVLPLLEPFVAVHAVDRRGRGRSGDAAGYSLALEFADIAAVVDAAADLAGGPVDLLGHSYGGNVAFGAASLTSNIRRLVLYEGWPPPNAAHRTPPPGLIRDMESLLARGEREQMLETFYRAYAVASDDEIGAIKASPTWPARVAAAHTVPRECVAFGAHAFDAKMAANIDLPVLLLVGSQSTDEIKADPDVVAAALPQGQVHILAGHAHLAHLTGPDMFADSVLSFLRK